MKGRSTGCRSSSRILCSSCGNSSRAHDDDDDDDCLLLASIQEEEEEEEPKVKEKEVSRLPRLLRRQSRLPLRMMMTLLYVFCSVPLEHGNSGSSSSSSSKMVVVEGFQQQHNNNHNNHHHYDSRNTFLLATPTTTTTTRPSLLLLLQHKQFQQYRSRTCKLVVFSSSNGNLEDDNHVNNNGEEKEQEQEKEQEEKEKEKEKEQEQEKEKEEKEKEKEQETSVSSSSSSSSLWKPQKEVVVLFSLFMIVCGGVLGPFLDTYHSIFGVLEYDEPITRMLWSSNVQYPALVTTWWVPELFGLAGFIIGWLYILLDQYFYNYNNHYSNGIPTVMTPPKMTDTNPSTMTRTTGATITTRTNNTPSPPPPPPPSSPTPTPSGPKILIGIALFTFQYWLSGILFASNILTNHEICIIMSLYATIAFIVLDRTWSGFITSTATAIGGPLIEIGLISFFQSYDTSSSYDVFSYGYHYTDIQDTGFFPYWIIPVYFLGGPAVGNLARGCWNTLSSSSSSSSSNNNNHNININNTNNDSDSSVSSDSTMVRPHCLVCNDTRCMGCPNCDGIGTYVAMGGRTISCNCCKGRGYVICRNCFSFYNDDPYDIDSIRQKMSQMPD